MQKWSLGILATFTLLLSSTAHAADEQAAPDSSFDTFKVIQSLTRDVHCSKARHSEIQKELAEISENDQAERLKPNADMTKNDTKRRVRVAAIAAEACLKEKNDYFIAAVVYQHGSLPEHYLQAIIYASKATELGHPVGGQMREATIDRYLMSLGYKQIFGSQVTAPAAYKEFESEKDGIPCLWPVEDAIDLVKDYNFGAEAYRTKQREILAAKKQQIPECNFQARSSAKLLPFLMELKI